MLKGILAFVSGIVIGVIFRSVIVRAAWLLIEYARHELTNISQLMR